MKKLLLIFLGLFLLSVNVKAKNSESKNILCFGNSLTAGYGVAQEDSWPMLIQEKINSKGFEYEVIQSGLSGETSAGGLSRIKWVMKKPVDVFILELGPNDGLRGLPLEHTKTNLQKIIDIVRNKNPEVKILLAGMRVPPNMGPEYSDKFVKIFEELAKENSAELIPFFLNNVAGRKELNLSDGIHPNEQGQKIVAENVWKYLEPMLEK